LSGEKTGCSVTKEKGRWEEGEANPWGEPGIIALADKNSTFCADGIVKREKEMTFRNLKGG